MDKCQAREAAADFISRFSARIRNRGQAFFAVDAVLKLEFEDTGRVRAIVRDGSLFQVALEYDDEDNWWKCECTCSKGYECEHICAALLAFRHEIRARGGASPATAQRGGGAPGQEPPSSPEVPQPAATPLAARLNQALGRKLDAVESEYIQRVQRLHTNVAHGFKLTSAALRRLSPAVDSYSFEPLSLWPAPPRTDFEFWLYCAWELRRRGAAYPAFMDSITDFSRIEPRMRAWHRKNEIASWRALLANPSAHQTVETECVDLRLMVLPNQARIQWKPASDQKFKNLKFKDAIRIENVYKLGTLRLEPESDLLWAAVSAPGRGSRWFELAYDSPAAAQVLGRVLRLPNMEGRIVTGRGVPLSRSADPLRYQLTAARDAFDDYRLALVQADGSPAPPVLLALPGSPALYLTEEVLFPGPPPHGLGWAQPLRIPAPALEGLDGVKLLRRLNVELPQRLAQRLRPTTVGVKIYCDLKPTYEGSSVEAVYLRVIAEAKGLGTEEFAAWGWRALPAAGAVRKQGQADPGFIPLEDRTAQGHFPALIDQLEARWDDYHARWRIRLARNFPDLFVPWLASLPPHIEVFLDPELASLRDAPLAGSVRFEAEETAVDWFDLKVVLDVSTTQLTPEELKLLLNARGGYIRLGKKGWRRLEFNLSKEDDERLARLGLDARDFSAEPQRLHALQLADDAARKFLPEPQAERIQRRAAELKTRVNPPVPAAISAQLRPYQLEGFHFLAYLSANRFGGVLADDMGLGKTVQALTWLAWLRAQPEGATLPSLVVCPKSVMDNWRAEAERFCPELRVRLWRGEEAAALETAHRDSDLVVLNYAQLRSLNPLVAQRRWLTVILDEAQYIKNPNSQTAQIARSLQASHRLALTGTPIENRLLDLWSILAFAMPGVLGNRTQFARRYDKQEDPLARRRLSARVRPFLLRRTKNQVAQDLPDRIEEDLICEMEGDQRTLYQAEFKRAQQLLLNIRTQQELNEHRFNLLTSLLRLRQICCHPALVSAGLDGAESAKLNALLDLLEPLLDEGHKVLVFSQFVSMLEIIRRSVIGRRWPHFYLAGDTEDRGELVRKFQQAEGAAVFLISLKAGGFGLNLTAASYVVLFDPWWNPAVENQAIDRTHRIGQANKVIAYRLLIKESIEQKIRQLQKTKAALAEDVLGEEKFARSLTLDDLRFLFAE